ncbi:hypothetical protein [Kitasatospora sp. DSM 101779]|uniref:hypothetical protein n=1 Tax=Kitasatospora sp. DSM 101779 TaxID=2853165 RepID=UPI0021D92BF7|nr:hypothetical protein [Kitasatospora sp. DSM 101779]MCU7826035.1 hypothetical protein [Kitasatospora sp. DSM 101779]
MSTPQQPDEDATVRFGSKPPRADQTVRLNAPAADPEATVRLGSSPVPAPDPEGTVRLGPAKQPDPDGTVRLNAPRSTPDATVRLNAPAPAPDPEGTVRLGPAKQADPEGTVRLNAAKPDPEATVRLGSSPVPAADPDGTVRLNPAQPNPEATVRLGGAGARPAPQAYVPPPSQQQPPAESFESATFLDPQVWPTPPVGTAVPAPTPAMGTPLTPAMGTPVTPAMGTPVPPAAVPAPAAQDGLQRFGPGVPPQAAAVWHGATAVPPAPEQPKRRRRRWLLLPLLLLIAVLAWLAWDRYGRPVAVTGVAVRTDNAKGPACDGTAVITGAISTEGGAGNVRYRWKRSDGTDSGVLTQPVSSGRRTTDVVLRWTFQGHGSMQATATLEIVGPGSGTSSVTFPYTCP